MGWYFSQQSRRELIAELTQRSESERYWRETLTYTLRGNVLWSVVQLTPKAPTGETRTFIGCDLLQGSKGEWGYKPMDESMQPYYYSCPKRYLTMVPAQSPEWREKVLAHHQRRYPQRGVIKEANQ
ncbi:hypothetical protein [Serratia oryzae]|uniref:Uncharacterized protein n=1 Tax=Serratia oryzae TaxID=2034155 RepID=A0A1S8CL85_9GAMM|nr:hypothetical protein [Serratia oryzae]OMQ24622.1 hypothetical protein BMI79_07305 [Serratia oryzae]VXC71805.1 conserved hypothetical protein [Enterobacterales bacterium 8AC]